MLCHRPSEKCLLDKSSARLNNRNLILNYFKRGLSSKKVLFCEAFQIIIICTETLLIVINKSWISTSNRHNQYI